MTRGTTRGKTLDKSVDTTLLADDSGTLPDGVYSDGALLWRANPGASTTFEDLLAARELFQDLHNDRDWNPWRFEAGTDALERAKNTIGEWKRAEPGFRQRTAAEVDEWMAQCDADFKREQAKRKRQREKTRARYDADRNAARLDLLEHQHILARRLELSQARFGQAFPLIDPEHRAGQVSELEESVAQHETEVKRLLLIVGDPEDVVDQYGNLPRDRRETSLYYYRERRIARVRHLQNTTAELRARHDASSDNAERSTLHSKLSIDQCYLDDLLAIPRLRATDMCADCVSPRHGHPAITTPPSNSPCAAWPSQRTIRAKIMKMLELAREPGRSAPEPPKPKPLAVVPSGLPITEIITRLQDHQRKHPDAVIRRGRANLWELWPPPEATVTE